MNAPVQAPNPPRPSWGKRGPSPGIPDDVRALVYALAAWNPAAPQPPRRRRKRKDQLPPGPPPSVECIAQQLVQAQEREAVIIGRIRAGICQDVQRRGGQQQRAA